MSVRSARIYPIRLPLRTPLETAHGSLCWRDSLILEVSDDEGRRGFGEAAPIAGFPGESLAEARLALEDWIRRSARSPRDRSDPVGADFESPVPVDRSRVGSARLSGEEGFDPARLDPSAALGAGAPVAGRSAQPHEMPATPIARGALATALFDLEAQARGISMAAYLLALSGAPLRSALDRAVPVNALLGEVDARALAAAGQRAVAEGFRTLKVKVGALSLERDCERLGALRAALGPEIRIRADANAAWEQAEAVRACAAFAPFALEWLEQPVAAEALSALHAVADASPVPIAADESAAAGQGALAVIEAGKCQALILKPALLGGPLEALRLAARARECGMQVAVTTLIDSAIGRAMALHVAAALSGLPSSRLGSAGPTRPPTAHGLATFAWLQDDVCRPAHERACAGALKVPDAAGLGIAPEPAALERLRWEER